MIAVVLVHSIAMVGSGGTVLTLFPFFAVVHFPTRREENLGVEGSENLLPFLSMLRENSGLRVWLKNL